MKELPSLKEVSTSPSAHRACHPGHTSQLAPMLEELLNFVEEYRLMGFAILKKMLIFSVGTHMVKG